MAYDIHLETFPQGKDVKEPLEMAPEALFPQADALTPEQRKRVDSIKSDIDLMNPQTVLQYGAGVQRGVSTFSDNILAQTLNRDNDHIGELVSSLLCTIKDVDVAEMGAGSRGRIPFFKGASGETKKLRKRYEKLEVQLDRIEQDLELARMQMLKDITMFDGLYARNLAYFQELQLYIVAGEEKLREVREQTLPRLRKEAEAKNNPISAQAVRDLESVANQFERKIYDLKLSKTVALQMAPQIRLIQDSDKALVDKIQTALLSTIPLWKNQMVIALGLQRQQDVLQLQRNISATTNALSASQIEALRQRSADVARSTEKGVVEVETLQKTNDSLIGVIEETLQLQQEGRAARQHAEAELVGMEARLK